MDRIKKVSFVIPCYRSEHTLPHVVKEIRETVPMRNTWQTTA